MLSLNNNLLHHSLVLLFCLIFIIFIIRRHFNISENIYSEYAFLLQLSHFLKYVYVYLYVYLVFFVCFLTSISWFNPQ